MKNNKGNASFYKCEICGGKFDGFGNNPWPVKDHGRCCDKCNEVVILERIKLHQNEKSNVN